MILRILGSSILQNMLTKKGIVRAGATFNKQGINIDPMG